MKKSILVCSLLLAVFFLGTSCCPRNPLMNTAISAHGNTDWHVDTANEFLFGTDMGGVNTAANHCPDTWTRRHIHVGLTNTNHFYYDKDVASPGDDTDPTNGIDQAMLFFYAGHGNPTLWNTLGNNATQGNMRLGDCQKDNQGVLRYYWQCSCEVFAHGPKNCTGTTMEYACPGSFNGSADSDAMRNVYERWGNVLSPQLRMACGASTLAYCHESEANRIWDRYNNSGHDVADSFIEGLNIWGVVPLCITMGSSNVNTTPLVTDTVFTNQANASGTSHYHIQYLTNFASTIRPLKILEVLEMLPIYRLKPLPIPEKLRDMKFAESGNWMTATDNARQRPFQVKINRLSGSIYLKGEMKEVTEKVLEEKDYLAQAERILREYGLVEKEMAEPVGSRMMIESAPVKGSREETRKSQKNASVTYKRYVEYEGKKINVLGDGGTIAVQMNNDGSLLSASKVWRQIADVKAMAKIKRYEEALKEAEGQLKRGDKYKLDSWNWGYKEMDGNTDQRELHVVFQFAFVPRDNKEIIDFPPRLIEIQGQKE
jgi:hypothetical protein